MAIDGLGVFSVRAARASYLRSTCVEFLINSTTLAKHWLSGLFFFSSDCSCADRQSVHPHTSTDSESGPNAAVKLRVNPLSFAGSGGGHRLAFVA